MTSSTSRTTRTSPAPQTHASDAVHAPASQTMQTSARGRAARPLAARPAKVVMRAYEMSARSIPKKSKEAEASANRVRAGVRSDHYDSEYQVNKGLFKKPTFAFRAGVVDRLGEAFAQDPRTAKLLDVAKFNGESPFSREDSLNGVVITMHEALTEEHPDVKQGRAQMQALEDHLQERLDTQFVKNRPEFKAELRSAPPAKLYEYALSLVHNINDAVNGKEIRSETVATGEAAGSSSVDGARRGILGTVKAEIHGESTYSASFRGKQLVLDGSTYRVLVKTSASNAQELADSSRVLPVKARLIAEMAIEVSDVTRALEQRDPASATALSHWLNHSKIEFVTPTGTHPVELARASSDVAQNLAKSGIATPAMVSTLKRETGGTIMQRFDTHPLLGH